MDIALIPKNVLDALRKRRFTDADISRLTPEQAFSDFCEWNGLMRWSDTLIDALDGLRAATKEGTRE